MTMIENEQDVLNLLEAETRERAERHLYKYTDCGAYIGWLPDGVKLGTIVEGCDFGIDDVDPLIYPFLEDQWNQVIAYIEHEANLLWHRANAVCIVCDQSMEDMHEGLKDAGDWDYAPVCSAECAEQFYATYQDVQLPDGVFTDSY